ncbi:hypothetical protein HHI36_023608 [Cryptolaemus montrouzieri]|uniref:Uncharacterized protein n=1 Tax=Cryptolaemus montrouzieri TaxID=559131 RepID=A0ABD2PH99_9CUCU
MLIIYAVFMLTIQMFECARDYHLPISLIKPRLKDVSKVMENMYAAVDNYKQNYTFLNDSYFEHIKALGDVSMRSFFTHLETQKSFKKCIKNNSELREPLENELAKIVNECFLSKLSALAKHVNNYIADINTDTEYLFAELNMDPKQFDCSVVIFEEDWCGKIIFDIFSKKKKDMDSETSKKAIQIFEQLYNKLTKSKSFKGMHILRTQFSDCALLDLRKDIRKICNNLLTEKKHKLISG